jgi:uncharacterized membrane protein
MSIVSNLSGHAASTPEVRRVSLTQPFTWLSKGWDDLLHHKSASLAYGALVSAMGAMILIVGRHPYLHAAAISGFLLVGPVMATGLCELSRRRTRGEDANFEVSLQVLSDHRSSLMRYAGTLLLFSVVWFVVSSLMLYLAFGSVAPSYFETMWGDVLINLTVTQIVSYLVLGGILACAVFALSVVSVPMIIDRNADAGTAMRTSLRATLEADLPVMIVWGALCVTLVGIGFATFLLGMIVVFPLLGHATWYAYLDLVPPSKDPAQTSSLDAFEVQDTN